MTNHVPTLETCQNLKAAGFPQETYFQLVVDNKYPEHHAVLPTGAVSDFVITNSHCAAPLLTEILEQLPDLDDGSLFAQLQSLIGQFALGHTTIQETVEDAALLWLELKEQS